MPKRLEYTPEEVQAELMELLIKGARRCAYDLRHAADDIGGTFWHSRADMWIGIFDPARGLKDYRTRLHHTIMEQSATIEGLRELCRSKGVEMGNLDEFPF